MNTLLQSRIKQMTRLLGKDVPADLPVRHMIRFPDGGVPAERALGAIWVSDSSLCALAVMEDSDVFNTAKGRRAKTWETGDVMELFIQPDAQKKDYFEYHVTPSGATLSLRIADAEKLRADVYPFESLLFDSAFDYQSGWLDAAAPGWWGYAAVPIGELELTGPHRARGCICRYNCNTGWTEPECSSTALLTGCTSFHTPERWHPIGETTGAGQAV
jgi:hypothetical protein